MGSALRAAFDAAISTRERSQLYATIRLEIYRNPPSAL